MSGIIFICLFSTLAALGIFTLFTELLTFTYKKIPLNVTLHSRDLKNETEYFIRSLYAQYPNTRVTVVNDGDKNQLAVLNALQRQYSSLFIVDA